MTIRELIQTVDEVRDVLVEKFIDTFDRKPKKEELLEYVKKIYRDFAFMSFKYLQLCELAFAQS